MTIYDSKFFNVFVIKYKFRYMLIIKRKVSHLNIDLHKIIENIQCLKI